MSALTFWWEAAFNRRSGEDIPRSGLQLWLDANTVTGLADSASMASWPDRSGSGAVVAQATGVSRPTFRIIGGVPMVSFPTAAVGFPIVWGSAQATAERTTFIVGYNANAVTTRQIMYRLGPDNQTGDAQLAYSVDLNNGGFTFQQFAPNPSGLAVPTTAAVMVVLHSTSGTGRSEGPGRWLYLNGRRSFRTQDANGSAADITTAAVTGITGGYIGGLNTGGGSFGFTGFLRAVLDYNRALSESEIAQVTAYLVARYGTATSLGTPTRNLIMDGDSLTLGYQGQSSAAGYSDAIAAALPATIRLANLGIGVVGETMAQVLAKATGQVDPLYDASVAKNTIVVWAGTNDLNNSVSPATVYANLQTYCAARRLKGFKVVVGTTLPRGAVAQFETDRQTLNTNIRSNWATFADALADFGNDANIGAAGQQNNVTYFNADKIHLTSVGYGIAAGIATTAVNTL